MKRIPSAVLRDAINVCGSMYRMNARYATGYSFNCNDAGDAVASGEFTNDSDNPDRWDGVIRFEPRELRDNISGKIYSLDKKGQRQ